MYNFHIVLFVKQFSGICVKNLPGAYGIISFKDSPQKINVTITDTTDRNICRFFIAFSGELSR